MPIKRPALAAAALLSAFALPTAAHHTFVTKYDPNKLVTVTGTVGNVAYANPHIFFDITGKTKAGSEATWRVETEGILAARGKGLTQTLLQDGAKATVTGWLARDNPGEIGLKSISVGGRAISMRNTAR